MSDEFVNNLLPNVKNNYYFGIGGLGDFFLLMSSFYDDVQLGSKIDVIFICNNINNIREATKLFPKINRWWLFPTKMFNKSIETWYKITNNASLCFGTGVTPYEFDYIKDWIKCGKNSNVFDYYKIKRNPQWAQPIKSKEKIVVIQPYGGADDKTKIKEIPIEDVKKIINNYYFENYKVYLMGSKIDQQLMISNGIDDVEFISDICEATKLILQAKSFYGVDSWGKTIAGLANIDFILIYPNKYRIPVETMFNHLIDPGDYIFLKDWRFSYADGRNF